MAICPHCGSVVSYAAKFCQNCGAPLPADTPIEQTDPTPYTPVSYPREDVCQKAPQPVTPIPTGGLMAWAIITMLLSTIPGIVAIVKTLNINKATSVEEQQKRYKSARTWCIIGTIIGVFAMFGYFGGRVHY